MVLLQFEYPKNFTYPCAKLRKEFHTVIAKSTRPCLACSQALYFLLSLSNAQNNVCVQASLWLSNTTFFASCQLNMSGLVPFSLIHQVKSY